MHAEGGGERKRVVREGGGGVIKYAGSIKLN
jgi:hypothetical protein